jgi:hypothetical protein
MNNSWREYGMLLLLLLPGLLLAADNLSCRYNIICDGTALLFNDRRSIFFYRNGLLTPVKAKFFVSTIFIFVRVASCVATAIFITFGLSDQFEG